MEMVGDWNPRGGSHSRGEAQAEWRRLSDRAYSPLCFRSQARPAGSSFSLYYTHRHLHLRGSDIYTWAHLQYTRTHIQCARVSLHSLRWMHTETVRFPPSWSLYEPSLSTSAIQLWEQLRAPFGAILSYLVFLFFVVPGLDRYVLLRQHIRKFCNERLFPRLLLKKIIQQNSAREFHGLYGSLSTGSVR